MTYYYIKDESDYVGGIDHIYEYCKNYEAPRIAQDFETYSIVPSVIDNPDLIPEPITYHGLDREQLEEQAYKRTGMKLLAQDEGHIALMQIGLDPTIGHDEQFIFDVRYLGYELLREDSKLKWILENATVIGHNLVYEAMFNIKQLGIWMQYPRDTLIMGRNIHAGDNYKHTLYGEYKKFFPKSFFLSHFDVSNKNHKFVKKDPYLMYEEWKEAMQKSDWADPVLTPDQLDYAADDVRGPMYLFDFQKKALKKLVDRLNSPGLYKTIRLDCNLINEFACMKLRGIPLDVEYHQENVVNYLEEKYEKEAQNVGKWFTTDIQREEPYDHMTKDGKIITRYMRWTEIAPINLRSSDQIKRSLMNAGLKLPAKKSTEAATLKKFRKDHPAVEHILRAKKAGHLNSNFGSKLIDLLRTDGKLHPGFIITRAKTGRSAGVKPNMMQMPRAEKLFGEIVAALLFRRSFISRAGTVWLSADFSQIEPRMIAQITKAFLLIKELCDPNGDIHALAGQLFQNMDYKPTKKEYGNTYERDTVGKTGGLQVLYRAGDKSFAEYMYDKTIDEEKPVIWTPKEAGAKKKQFFDGFPEILQAMYRLDAEIDRHLEKFESLRYFKNRRPIFEMICPGTIKDNGYCRYEKWCLSEKQEAIAKYLPDNISDPQQDPLHKWHKVTLEVPILDEEGNETGEVKYVESYYNEYKKTRNAITREAWNFLFQGACANIFKLAVLRMSEELKKILNPLEEGIVCVVHDEVNLIVKEENEQAALKIMEESMLWAGEQFIDVVPIDIEWASGTNWAETH